ncbi:nitrilase family protein [Olivibacter sitiensis]|uniref:nitrilase family protein n=1 Tax=Olivibacter sitiensis TaxID=376470 RepID=UPI00041CF9A0|nr:nitrilase family protein [Olivibacter sitiensis]
MKPLKITIFQAYLFWENTEKNLTNLGLRLSNIKEKTDLIILPEMFNTGFTMNVEKCAEKIGGPTTYWMLEQAKKFQAVVAGSLIIEEDGKYYNRFIWMRPDGTFNKYDKRHLFSLAKEDELFTAGKKRTIVELHGWKICLQTCYDLRFPAFSRNLNAAYDILLYIASWPDRRISHWRALIPARAIENQAIAIGVNRVGYDGNQVYHSGCSMCVGPDGNVIYYKPEDEDLYTFTLTADDLLTTREKLPFLKDADAFKLVE